MEDFAKRQLQKYGWSEGQGLGKNGGGLVEPVKIKLKRDTVGVGYSPVTEDTAFWWASSYNRAASGLSVSNTEGSVRISSAQDVAGDVSRRCYDGHRDLLVHRGFLPSRVTQQGGREEREGGVEIDSAVSTTKVDDESVWRVSDEELLRACRGRTAHKAARHGLNLSGKLQRLQAQDERHRQSNKKQKLKRRQMHLH